jgi:hypothetical protein
VLHSANPETGVTSCEAPLARYLRGIALSCTDPQLVHRLNAIAQHFADRRDAARDQATAPRQRPETDFPLRSIRAGIPPLESTVHFAGLQEMRRTVASRGSA